MNIISETDDYVLFDYVSDDSVLMWDKDMESWHLNGWITLTEAVKKCKISTDEAIAMALKYGK